MLTTLRTFLLFALFLGSTAFEEAKAPVELIEGTGFLNLEIGNSKLKHVEAVMETNYQAAIFSYDQSNISLTTLNYKEQGVVFQFKGQNRNSKLHYIYLSEPFKGITSKGIKIGGSTMNEVVGAYGASPWKLSGQDLYKEYKGISFYASTGKSLHYTDLKDQTKLDELYGDLKVSKIILSPLD